jgi:hypothetical protein
MSLRSLLDVPSARSGVGDAQMFLQTAFLERLFVCDCVFLTSASQRIGIIKCAKESSGVG